MLDGSTGFTFSEDDVSRATVGSRPDMLVFDCGFTDRSLI